MATIAVLGTLDSKGHEHEFVATRIRENGHNTLLIDFGTAGDPQVAPDISRDQVASVGNFDLTAMIARKDRGECVTAMAQATPTLLSQLHEATD